MFPVFIFLLTLKGALSLPSNAYVGQDGSVGASWGGYSARAGPWGSLGRGRTEGGLRAEAGTQDGHFAAAGLRGSTSGVKAQPVGDSSSASKDKPQNNLFDNIFNIPISTLGAVNKLLKNRKQDQTQNTDSTAASSRKETPQKHPKKQPNYDDIFNIPITALGAVNHLLKG